jgi:hypothetical protein
MNSMFFSSFFVVIIMETRVLLLPSMQPSRLAGGIILSYTSNADYCAAQTGVTPNNLIVQLPYRTNGDERRGNPSDAPMNSKIHTPKVTDAELAMVM